MADSTIGIGGLNLGKDEVTSSAFDLFAPIEIENSIKKANKIIVRPIASTNSRGPFKFVIPSDPEKWTDCESIRLSGKVKILKNTGGYYQISLPTSVAMKYQLLTIFSSRCFHLWSVL